jgi:hypothetical protein
VTPAERDEVREFAEFKVRNCAPGDGLVWRAILLYVPAGVVDAPAGFTIHPVAATDDKPAAVVTVSPKGRWWPLDVEMARQMGAAYMAAADAAEES